MRMHGYIKYIDRAIAHRSILHSARFRIFNLPVGRRSVVKRTVAVQRCVLNAHNASLDLSNVLLAICKHDFQMPPIIFIARASSIVGSVVGSTENRVQKLVFLCLPRVADILNIAPKSEGILPPALGQETMLRKRQGYCQAVRLLISPCRSRHLYCQASRRFNI